MRFSRGLFGLADMALGWSLLAIAGSKTLCIATIGWIFRTVYRIRQ